MKSLNYIWTITITCVAVLSLTGCTQKEPYFSGANEFEVQAIAPEGIRVVGKLWFHNTVPHEADHMVENVQVFIDGHEPIPVNVGRQHVIKIGGNARYDVPVLFYVPLDNITNGDVEKATLISNKKMNADFDFQIKGTATVLVEDTRYDMPVDYNGHIVVWPDLKTN